MASGATNWEYNGQCEKPSRQSHADTNDNRAAAIIPPSPLSSAHNAVTTQNPIPESQREVVPNRMKNQNAMSCTPMAPPSARGLTSSFDRRPLSILTDSSSLGHNFSSNIKPSNMPVPCTATRPPSPIFNVNFMGPSSTDGLPASVHHLYQQPITTLNILQFWKQYLSSILPATFDYVVKQWHSDPPYNTANRRYVVDIGVKDTSRLLLTGLIAQPHEFKPRSVYELIHPIPFTQRGLLLPGGEIVFFVADKEISFHVYNIRRDDVRTLIRFSNPLTEYLSVIQEFVGYLEELDWNSKQQNETFLPVDVAEASRESDR